MPAINHNDAYLELGGVDISPVWSDKISPKYKNDKQETTSGSGVEWRTFNPGLNGWEAKITAIWWSEYIQEHLHLFKRGLKTTLVWGPDGNDAGKPKFAASIIIDDVEGPTQSIEKEKWMYAISISGDGMPTSIIENGDTF